MKFEIEMYQQHLTPVVESKLHLNRQSICFFLNIIDVHSCMVLGTSKGGSVQCTPRIATTDVRICAWLLAQLV